jgi:phosphatidylserine/phosphatidylglycerophosphate/cardiolipin synthase-like enzyme
MRAVYIRAAVLAIFSLYAIPSHAAPADVAVCFTPAEHCEQQIVAAIDAAHSSIRVQAYGFTSFPIIHALQRAAERGVEVLAILDKVNEKRYSGATLLEAAGIPVWIDYEPAIAHNKIMIVDGHLTIGGSFNYTASAEKRNAENVTFTESEAVAAQFLANWERRLKASREFDAATE